MILVVLVPLHVVPIDERFDPFLQVGRLERRSDIRFGALLLDKKETYLYWERQLLVQLADEKIVAERFPHLHDAHDRGVDLVLPVLVDAFLRGFLLFRLQN